MARANQLRLNNLVNARKTLTRLIRDYHAGEINEGEARCYAYLLNQLLAYFKVEIETDFEKRLDKLEAIMEEQQR